VAYCTNCGALLARYCVADRYQQAAASLAATIAARGGLEGIQASLQDAHAAGPSQSMDYGEGERAAACFAPLVGRSIAWVHEHDLVRAIVVFGAVTALWAPLAPIGGGLEGV
jgi:hypothetical protein